MKFPRLIATIAAALAFAAPATASIVTYDVSISGGSYLSSMNSFDYGLSANTDLGEIDPAINGTLGITAHFSIDTAQGTLINPMFANSYESSNGTFINSTIMTNQPTPGLVSQAMGTQNAQVFIVGSSYYFSIYDSTYQNYYDAGGTLIRRVSEYVGHQFVLNNITNSVLLDGRTFPRLSGSGIFVELGSNHEVRDYDLQTGIELTRSWSAFGQGELGVTASVTDSLGTNAAPEPASLALLALGLAGVAVGRRTRAKA